MDPALRIIPISDVDLDQVAKSRVAISSIAFGINDLAFVKGNAAHV